jgi:anti-sigma factor RsiW
MPAVEHIHTPTPEEIMEYLDGEGTADARDAVGTHLASCAACRAIADEQLGLSGTARAWQVGAAPASLRPLADTRGHAVAPRIPFYRRSRILLAGLSAAAAILILVSIGGRQQRRPAAAAAAIDALSVRTRSATLSDAPGRIAGNVHGGVPGGVVGGVVGGLPAAPPPPGEGLRDQASGVLPSQSAARPSGPQIIRTATLSIVARDFGGVRESVEGLVTQAGGFIDQMTVTGDASTARTLRGTLRVPGDRLPDTLARLRQLGQVVEDTQGSQDVTDEIVDLDARLVSARATEQRLIELLRTRTGRLSDVLEVERELTRVRLDIERLDAEKTNLGRRVSYATIGVTISEERKAGLDGPLSLATRLRIATADGLEGAFESITLTVLLLLRAGPALLLWGGAAALVWIVIRRRMKPSA